jgi:hypothetical protein
MRGRKGSHRRHEIRRKALLSLLLSALIAATALAATQARADAPTMVCNWMLELCVDSNWKGEVYTQLFAVW